MNPDLNLILIIIPKVGFVLMAICKLSVSLEITEVFLLLPRIDRDICRIQSIFSVSTDLVPACFCIGASVRVESEWTKVLLFMRQFTRIIFIFKVIDLQNERVFCQLAIWDFPNGNRCSGISKN